MKILSALTVVTFLCSACNANFEIIDFPYTPASNGIPAKNAVPPENGIIFYEMGVYRVQYSFTKYVDAKTKELENSCDTVLDREEVSYFPDLKSRRAIVYHPSIFSNSQMQISLSNGILTGTNTQNSPATAALIGTAETAIAAAGLLAAHTVTALPNINEPSGKNGSNKEPASDLVVKTCNAGSEISKIIKVDDFTTIGATTP